MSLRHVVRACAASALFLLAGCEETGGVEPAPGAAATVASAPSTSPPAATAAPAFVALPPATTAPKPAATSKPPAPPKATTKPPAPKPVATTPAPVRTSTKPVALSTCGAPANPWGYNFCGRGSTIASPPASFCDYFDCIASFWESTNGYVMECDDGMYSHSGGRSGSCSHHGGNNRPLYG